jgi:hypothetical protein
MNTTEIVIREVQSDGGFQMRQLLAECIGEPRKSSHRHPHVKVLSFHHRRTDMFGVRIAGSDFGYNPRDPWWGVPRIGSVELPVVAKHLRKLRKVYVQTKAHRYAACVVMQAVTRDLRPAFDAGVQVPEKCGGIAAKPLADVKRGDQLRLRVNRHKNPLTPKFFGIARADALLFLSDPRPNLINLKIPGTKAAQSRVHQSSAAFTCDDEKSHDRVAIQSGEPFGTADRASLKQTVQGTFYRVGIGQECIAGKSLVGFAEGGIAGSAAPALNAPFAKKSEPFAVLVVTSSACHGAFSVYELRRKPYNLFGSGSWLTPRFGLAPTAVDAEAGAHYVRVYCVKVYPLGWIDNDFHRWTVGSEANCDLDSHCVLPSYRAVFQALRGLYLLPKSRLVGSSKVSGAARESVLLARPLSNPPKGTDTVNNGCFYLCGLKPLGNGVDGSQGIRHILTKVETAFHEPSSQRMSSDPCIGWRGLQGVTNGIRQALGANIEFVKPLLKSVLLIFRQHSESGADELMQLCDLGVQAVTLLDLSTERKKAVIQKFAVVITHG